MARKVQHLETETAIDMAFASGELLFQQDHEIHDWALTLIISNLFELAAHVEEPRARFEQGFDEIVGENIERELPFGWQPRYVAEAIRNMLDHGLDLDRKQTKNDRGDEKAGVESMGFIPHKSDTTQRPVVFDIYQVGEQKFVLLVSPMLYWSYVQEWYRRRTGQ